MSSLPIGLFPSGFPTNMPYVLEVTVSVLMLVKQPTIKLI
jgi:hypothetical protein